MEPEFTIDGNIKTVEQFRILSVGQSGVGKSSLINCVFGITKACVVCFKPGESDIEQGFISQDNPHFVLHDSKGFEPGDITNFETRYATFLCSLFILSSLILSEIRVKRQ
ncbi:hypothetical protein D9756_010203 [Leucocoprinus leucothites]|uniref:G domain-containing protein n=1 Tax=Leucocoprinus leucothites TaxID=201217 RepID=A0A8H5CUL8_9AGAR|nr:hypothetical protein D9756_010203 [Leucoagaricus leucothites]